MEKLAAFQQNKKISKQKLKPDIQTTTDNTKINNKLTKQQSTKSQTKFETVQDLEINQTALNAEVMGGGSTALPALLTHLSTAFTKTAKETTDKQQQQNYFCTTSTQNTQEATRNASPNGTAFTDIERGKHLSATQAAQATQMQERFKEEARQQPQSTTIKGSSLTKSATATDQLNLHATNANNTDKLTTAEANTAANTAAHQKTTSQAKPSKDLKFAEKLRRSFRRSEHKSLEIKRCETNAAVSTTNKSSTAVPDNNNQARRAQQLQKHTQSIFSLSNLPGIGGHINPALLLDSPDESTPPEFAYQHLSSVATTNSSTSLESNFEFCETVNSPTTTTAPVNSEVHFWAWQQQNQTNSNNSSTNAGISMGSDLSTSTNANNAELRSPYARRGLQTSSASAGDHSGGAKKKQLEQQASSKSESATPPQFGLTAAPSSTGATSRSCSITSESSSIKLTRLHNFLFKSSNESTRSYQGHSNEAFTASSHNSSSGEWENLGAFSSGNATTADFRVGSFPEETGYEEFPAETTTTQLQPQQYSPDAHLVPTITYAATVTTTTSAMTAVHSTYDDDEGGPYYQYTLTSPNNPFLPEITARTYHSPCDTKREEEDELDKNITSVKYERGAHSAQLPTPAYSRAGSQESTHSEGGASASGSMAVPSPTFMEATASGHSASASSSSASTPGRHKRKLFSLHSPTRLLLQQQHQHQSSPTHHHQQHTTQALVHAPPAVEQGASPKSLRSLNPFLPLTGSGSSSPKRSPRKQTAISSPVSVQSDLNAKREEFLRATMKICLVVSPPNTKLQLKSKSLTHLDGLDTVVANQQPAELPVKPSKPSSTKNAQRAAQHDDQQQEQEQYLQHRTQNEKNLYEEQQMEISTSATAINQYQLTPTTTPMPIPTATTSPSLVLADANATGFIAAGGGGGGASFVPVFHHNPRKRSVFLRRKKPMLTRSEVSSSEYFSISFISESNGTEDEFIAATKGVTLGVALQPALKRRNLTFSQIIVTHRDPAPTYFIEADENTEVDTLAGTHLLITEREGCRKTLQKAASFGARTRPPRLLSSASTEEASESSSKQLKQRFSGLFGLKSSQQSLLCDLLNNFTKNGVPQRSKSLNFDHPELQAALKYLDNGHSNWRDFVDWRFVPESDHQLQNAIWELVTTEVYYIHSLQTVTDLFLACLEAVQEQRLLTDVDQKRLFSNVRDICEANLKFWTIYLYPMVAHSVITREPLRWAFFQHGFAVFGAIFAPYKKYCAEQSTCQFYCKELARSNSLFTSYLAWCESQKMCNRLRLADILVRPMQRLTKYSLLLSAIRKNLTEVREMEALDIMVLSVETFVFSVNNHLTTRQENERLKGVMSRIESYDVVDSNNEQLDKLIKQHSQMFDLCAPMKGCVNLQDRHLFMEGDHKFKDSMGKADVHCFLFTDVLLVCKAIAKKGLGSLKVIRQPYLTDRLVVTQNNNVLNCVYLNEFDVAITAFTLQCIEAKNWYDALRRAKKIYKRLKQSTNMGDSIRYANSVLPNVGTTDSLGVKKSPMNSSICSRVSSANNSHSGSVEWNDSRNISVDFEKTNSLSSEEGSGLMVAGLPKVRYITPVGGGVPHVYKVTPTTSSNTLSVQPGNHLGQSLPNLNLSYSHTNLYHTYSNNTLLVPGTTTSHSGNLLLSPSHRGISYPPPSPTRVPLRRGMAFSTSTKNPPLLKTRNITSQNSVNWQQIPATPTPPTPQSQQHSPNNDATAKQTATLTQPPAPGSNVTAQAAMSIQPISEVDTARPTPLQLPVSPSPSPLPSPAVSSVTASNEQLIIKLADQEQQQLSVNDTANSSASNLEPTAEESVANQGHTSSSTETFV